MKFDAKAYTRRADEFEDAKARKEFMARVENQFSGFGKFEQLMKEFKGDYNDDNREISETVRKVVKEKLKGL